MKNNIKKKQEKKTGKKSTYINTFKGGQMAI
jgi:hypothetical protein